MGKRLPAPRTSNMVSPGPGTYDVKAEASLLSSPGWKIGTSTRNDTDKQKMRNSNFPPPDTYNPEYTKIKASDPKWGFGSSVRQSLVGGNPITPSPNTYSIPARTGFEGPKFQMGLKNDGQSAIATEQKKTRSNPGPGAYTPNFYRTVKQDGIYTLKERHPIKIVDLAPGPGAYNAKKSPEKQQPSYRFGTSAQREKTPVSCAPGPGNYKIPSAIANMPAYTAARSKDFGYI